MTASLCARLGRGGGGAVQDTCSVTKKKFMTEKTNIIQMLFPTIITVGTYLPFNEKIMNLGNVHLFPSYH